MAPKLVQEMNRVGIMVDISHVSDEAFWDVMEITAAPAIASHSSARHFTAGWERNIDDDMIVRLAENGGVVMINYGSAFLTQAANEYSATQEVMHLTPIARNSGIEETDETEAAFRADYVKMHGTYPYATLEETLDHFDHVVKLTSIEHVGIGTDYDGVGDSLPIGLKDVSQLSKPCRGIAPERI